jgi:alanine-synthesizing transaminase
MEEFHRIRRLPPYVFEQVNRAKAIARNAGADIIDLGMGNPDLPAPAHVIEKLKDTLGKPRTDRYSASKGIPGLRRAQAAYYGRRFGVKLNPETQVIATLGSKEGFANVAQAITAPGDVVLVPDPSYPIHAFGFLMAGGVIRSVPSEPTPEFFPILERAIVHSIPKPLVVVVCYPSNPTAYVADRSGRGSRLLLGCYCVCEKAQSDRAFRSRLRGGLFRRSAAAVGAAGAWCGGHRGRVHLDVKDVLHAGLAHRICGRQ